MIVLLKINLLEVGFAGKVSLYYLSLIALKKIVVDIEGEVILCAVLVPPNGRGHVLS